jgi:hypothetical protein
MVGHYAESRDAAHTIEGEVATLRHLAQGVSREIL